MQKQVSLLRGVPDQQRYFGGLDRLFRFIPECFSVDDRGEGTPDIPAAQQPGAVFRVGSADALFAEVSQLRRRFYTGVPEIK